MCGRWCLSLVAALCGGLSFGQKGEVASMTDGPLTRAYPQKREWPDFSHRQVFARREVSGTSAYKHLDWGSGTGMVVRTQLGGAGSGDGTTPRVDANS